MFVLSGCELEFQFNFLLLLNALVSTKAASYCLVIWNALRATVRVPEIVFKHSLCCHCLWVVVVRIGSVLRERERERDVLCIHFVFVTNVFDLSTCLNYL